MSERKKVDWDGLEPHYRAGTRSLKDIGQQFEVSDAAIVKHARVKGWTRNLQAKIQAKADAKVSAAVVSAEVREKKALTEALVVDVESTVQARIRLAHRTDIAAYRKLSVKLLQELEAVTDNKELFEELYELLHDPAGEDDSAAARERDRKRREAFDKVMSLPGRQKVMKEAAETLRVLVALEREAHGVGPEEKPPEPPGGVDKDDLARRVIYMLAERCKIGSN